MFQLLRKTVIILVSLQFHDKALFINKWPLPGGHIGCIGGSVLIANDAHCRNWLHIPEEEEQQKYEGKDTIVKRALELDISYSRCNKILLYRCCKEKLNISLF